MGVSVVTDVGVGLFTRSEEMGVTVVTDVGVGLFTWSV